MGAYPGIDRKKKEERSHSSSHRGITCEASPEVRGSKLWMLEKKATTARQAFARGRKLAFAVERGVRSYSSLNKHEQALHGQFHTGKLEADLIEANKKKGEQAIEASQGNDVDLTKIWAGIIQHEGTKDNTKKGDQANEALTDDEEDLDKMWASG